MVNLIVDGVTFDSSSSIVKEIPEFDDVKGIKYNIKVILDKNFPFCYKYISKDVPTLNLGCGKLIKNIVRKIRKKEDHYTVYLCSNDVIFTNYDSYLHYLIDNKLRPQPAHFRLIDKMFLTENAAATKQLDNNDALSKQDTWKNIKKFITNKKESWIKGYVFKRVCYHHLMKEYKIVKYPTASYSVSDMNGKYTKCPKGIDFLVSNDVVEIPVVCKYQSSKKKIYESQLTEFYATCMLMGYTQKVKIMVKEDLNDDDIVDSISLKLLEWGQY